MAEHLETNAVDHDALRELLTGAPGGLLPMSVTPGDPGDWPIQAADGDYICASPDDGVRGGHDRSTANLIVAAVNALPALLNLLATQDAPAPCNMRQQEPFDFAWCETHDTTFPLGGTCKFNGREPWEVWAAEADEQRGLKVRAEMRAEAAEQLLEQAREVEARECSPARAARQNRALILLNERLIDLHDKVVMDTDRDRELHAQVITHSKELLAAALVEPPTEGEIGTARASVTEAGPT